MKKEYLQLKSKLATVAVLLCLTALMPLTAWAVNSVSTITHTENVTSNSTVYVGEVVVDGTSVIKYLYSGDVAIKSSVIQNLLDGLNGMTDKDYHTLLSGQDFDYEAGAKGLALCADPEKAVAMNANWSSSRYVGTLYYSGKTATNKVNSNLYDIDDGFKATLDAQAVARAAEIETLADVEKCIVTHLDSRTETDVYYTIEGGEVVRHMDANVIFDSEATTVIYTKAELETLPLTFEATTEGDITFSVTYAYNHPVVLTPIEYQINGGEWTTYTSWPADASEITSSTGNWPVTFGDAIHVSAGDKVAFRGTNASYYGNGTGYASHISSTADVSVYGNVMSLIDATNYSTLTTLTDSWNFAYLFRAGEENWAPVTNTTIKSHPIKELMLPATTITSACYYGMFAGCLSITRAPELPATTLEAQCYAEMFRATGLTAAPALPATEMRDWYWNSETDNSEGTMDCYMMMFQDCTSLTQAPELPATTLTHGVYQNMFQGCTSLTTAPVLPAAVVADGAYYRMFYGCTSLNYMKCLATDISAEMATLEWLDGVAATGTFVKAEITDYPRNESGIPEGWTVETEEGVGTTATLTAKADDEGNYWTTYYNGLASVSADENATVYTAKMNDDKSQVMLTKVTDNVIPAGNAVVMKSIAETVILTVADATGTLADNDLLGQSAPFSTPDNLFALVKGNSGVGFYRYPTTNGYYPTTYPAQKAYLIVEASAQARKFIPFGNDSTTGIDLTPSATSSEDATLYDLQGRKHGAAPSQLAPGVYVRNGKKVVIKK